MKRVSVKFVLRILTPEQKEQPLSISLELRHRVTTDPNFFQNVVTGDESWMYGYNPETKVQSSQWKTLNSPRPKKERQSKASECQSHIDSLFRPGGDCAVGVRT
jgi:hypothetical protein